MIRFSLRIEDDEVYRTLDRVLALVNDPQQVMRGVAGIMADAAEDQFEAEGKPAWQELAQVTIARRTKQGTWPGKILQVSGAGLAASVTPATTKTSAAIGSNKVYAAIQQLGGPAGRGRKVIIPARPYLVFGEGERDETLDLLAGHVQRALRA